jgi:MMP 1-O-methyltransferase
MLPIDIDSVKGFLDKTEGEALYQLTLAASAFGPCLEIGSYCGKSTVYLGTACQQKKNVLFAVDHHRGSEEHQLGEAYHDPDLFDTESKKMDSFREFRKTLAGAKLEDAVIPIVAPSRLVAQCWTTQLSLVFIDGGHSMQAAIDDYEFWSPHIMAGGYLAIHDVFPNPEDGGRPPYEIWLKAIASGLFEEQPLIKSLGILRRK